MVHYLLTHCFHPLIIIIYDNVIMCDNNCQLEFEKILPPNITLEKVILGGK